jgi:hypothetical protein
MTRGLSGRLWLEKPRNLDSFLGSKYNNLNLIRFFTAAMVIFGHSFDMMGRFADETLYAFYARSFLDITVSIFSCGSDC